MPVLDATARGADPRFSWVGSAKMGADPGLIVDRVGKTFPSDSPGGLDAVAEVTLEVQPGEFLSVVGPSGCGKSTFLQIVAGLMPPSRGEVWFERARVDGPPDGVVYLFQQYSRSLMPWRTAIANVEFALEGRMAGRARRRAFCMSFLERVGLGDFAGSYPWQMSGGMQQRLAIARALAAEPRLLLLDEPFSSVDALTRMELHDLILQLWEERRFTAVLVTHDVDEAVYLSDRIAVLSRRPSRISETIVTGLPRPRHRISTPEHPRFLEIRHHLLSSLTQAPGHD